MSLKEPSVPRIAITPDDDTLDRDIDDMIDGAVNTIDTHTDIEDLDDETDEVNVSKGKRKLSFKLKTGDDGAVTDVEDVEASDGDEDEETEIDLNSPQILAALENILDAEGSYEELFKHDSLSNSGKTVGSTGQHSFQGLGIPEDSRITGILTDVEDFSASEDEGIFKSYVKEVDAEFLTELLENMGTVDIADTVKKENQGVSPALTPSPGASPIHRRSPPESKERVSGYEAHGRTSPRSGRKSPTHRSALSPTYSGSIRRFSDVTDTEILDSDSEEEKTKAAVLSRTRRHPPKGKGSLRPPMLGKGSATDVEDVEFTDDEILGAKTKLEKRSNSPSSLVKDYTRKNIKHKERGQEMAGGKLLGVVYDPDEGHTDLEDMEASGTEDEVAMEHFHYIKDPPENVFSIEEMESMYGSVMESQTTVDTSGGLSASLENQLTDTEDLMEPSPIKFIRNKDDDQSSVSSGCSTEEGSLQGSDSEAKCARKAWREGKTTQLPVTQVKFFERPDGSDPVPVIVSPDPSKGNKKYLLKTKKSPLLVPQATDGGVTDVEELISSGESDSDEYGADNSEKQSGKKSPQQNSDDAATDLEDFEADNLEEIYFSHQLPADLNPEDIPGFPPPVRELTLVKQDEHGHPTVLVLPLDEVKARGLFNPEESGAIPTDVEDLEDSEDDVEDQGAGLRVIDAEGNRTLLVTPDLPPMEGGIVECTDTMKVEKKKLKLPSQAMADPITDTEEMFLDTSPVQRKRKVRSRPQSSHKKPPMPASPVVVTPPPTATIAASTTDIEELEVSDVDSLPPGVKVSPSSMKTMSLNADNSANNSDAKTDIEDVEASDVDERNEIPSDRDACPTPDLMREYGFETITEKQGDGPFSDDVRASVIVQHSQIRVSDTKHHPQKHGSIGSLPTIRMISPSPDIHGTTDTEELFASADEGRESPTPVEIPYEFEDHYSVVHVKHTRKIDIDAPGEAKYLKDHRILDAHTDVEDLGLSEEEGQHNDINVDYAAEAAEELGKHQESVLSGMAVYDGEKKVCVCTGSRDKDSDESLSKVCVCIGKPDGGITIVSEALAASETNAELQSAAASQRKKGSQGQQPADGATEGMKEIGKPLSLSYHLSDAYSSLASAFDASSSSGQQSLVIENKYHHDKYLPMNHHSFGQATSKSSVSHDKANALLPSPVNIQNESLLHNRNSPSLLTLPDKTPSRQSNDWKFFTESSVHPATVDKASSMHKTGARITGFLPISPSNNLISPNDIPKNIGGNEGNNFERGIDLKQSLSSGFFVNCSDADHDEAIPKDKNIKVNAELGKQGSMYSSSPGSHKPLKAQSNSILSELPIPKTVKSEQKKVLPSKNAIKRNSTVIIKSSRSGVEPQSMRARAGSVSKLISKFEELSATPSNPIKTHIQMNDTTLQVRENNSERVISPPAILPILNFSAEETSPEYVSPPQKEPVKHTKESSENTEQSSFKPVIRFTFLKDRSISPRRLDPNPIQESEAFKALCRDIEESSTSGFNRQSYRSLPSFSSPTANKTVTKPVRTSVKSMPKLSTPLSPGAVEAKHIIQQRQRREGAIHRSLSLNDHVRMVKDSSQKDPGYNSSKNLTSLVPKESKNQDSVVGGTRSLSQCHCPTSSSTLTDSKQSALDSQQGLQMSVTRRRILESLVHLRTKNSSLGPPATEIPDDPIRSESSHDCTSPALPSPVRVRSGLLKSAFVRSGSAPPIRLGQLFGEEWAEKMQQKHSAGHGGPATEDAGFHALHDAVAPPNQDSSSIIRTDVVAHDVFPDGNEVDFMNQKDWNTYEIGETPIGHLDTTSHHKDPIQIIRTVVCETPEKNVPLGLDSLEQFTEPSFPPNDFRYNSLGDKKGDNQDSNSNHTIFEAGPQIAQHILAATSTPSRPVRHSDGKSHTTNADNCKEEDEQESCQRDAFSDGGDSNMVDSESDGGESPLAVPKMRIKRTSRTVGSSSGSDFEDDASTSPVESSEGLALFTVSGSEFYQTQDPESTSEYDPSQTTTQARVVTTRTLTRTVMGEDGRPVSVTTTETEVSDGGGAEGVLDSNQLRESMQQIIDQFASEEEMKEGKESKEEKKPE